MIGKRRAVNRLQKGSYRAKKNLFSREFDGLPWIEEERKKRTPVESSYDLPPRFLEKGAMTRGQRKKKESNAGKSFYSKLMTTEGTGNTIYSTQRTQYRPSPPNLSIPWSPPTTSTSNLEEGSNSTLSTPSINILASTAKDSATGPAETEKALAGLTLMDVLLDPPRAMPEIDELERLVFRDFGSWPKAKRDRSSFNCCLTIIQALQAPLVDLQVFDSVTSTEFNKIMALSAENREYRISVKLVHLPHLNQLIAMLPFVIHKVPIQQFTKCINLFLCQNDLSLEDVDRDNDLITLHTNLPVLDGETTTVIIPDLCLDLQPPGGLSMHGQLKVVADIVPELDAAFLVSIHEAKYTPPPKSIPLYTLQPIPPSAFAPPTHTLSFGPVVVEAILSTYHDKEHGSKTNAEPLVDNGILDFSSAVGDVLIPDQEEESLANLMSYTTGGLSLGEASSSGQEAKKSGTLLFNREPMEKELEELLAKAFGQ
ncbi:hypothetical protein EV401DRAFT_2083147 [Pisolithus croceorrhizus]|nr:hypothetical protein EV401DRAFT_2083147 [Pisolithus croceorrhizus]